MENDRYLDLVRQKRSASAKSDREYKESSRDRLTKIIDTKMRTVMIGALATIEENMGFLWRHGEKCKLTPEEEDMKRTFDKMRKEILDKGNTQSRNLHTEIEQYNVEWLRYNLSLPIISDE